MNRKLYIYNAIERVMGRRSAWRLGRFLYLGARRELVNDPRYNGEYALQGWVISSIGRPTKHCSSNVFVDVGANVGNWTAHLVEKLHARGVIRTAQIHCFEPAPDQRSSLRARLSHEIEDQSVRVHSLALGRTVQRSSFVVTGSNSGSSAIATGKIQHSGKVIEVDVSTFDEIAKRLDVADVLLLKIDTEGNDFNVIAGAREMLKEERVKVIQFEYNWRWIAFGHWLKTVFNLIEDLNYSLGLLTQNRIEFYSTWHPELERYAETNYVLVHNEIVPDLPHCHMNFDYSSTPVVVPSGDR